MLPLNVGNNGMQPFITLVLFCFCSSVTSLGLLRKPRNIDTYGCHQYRKSLSLSPVDVDYSTNNACVALVNTDFSIVRVGFAGALAGGFRGM